MMLLLTGFKPVTPCVHAGNHTDLIQLACSDVCVDLCVAVLQLCILQPSKISPGVSSLWNHCCHTSTDLPWSDVVGSGPVWSSASCCWWSGPGSIQFLIAHVWSILVWLHCLLWTRMTRFSLCVSECGGDPVTDAVKRPIHPHQCRWEAGYTFVFYCVGILMCGMRLC